MTEWQPIETAPKDGTNVLVIVVEHPESHCVLRHQDGQWLNDEFFDVISGEQVIWYEPTHWMPLPDPPSKDQASD